MNNNPLSKHMAAHMARQVDQAFEREAADIHRTLSELRDELYGTVEPTPVPKIEIDARVAACGKPSLPELLDRFGIAPASPKALTRDEHTDRVLTKNQCRAQLLAELANLHAATATVIRLLGELA